MIFDCLDIIGGISRIFFLFLEDAKPLHLIFMFVTSTHPIYAKSSIQWN